MMQPHFDSLLVSFIFRRAANSSASSGNVFSASTGVIQCPSAAPKPAAQGRPSCICATGIIIKFGSTELFATGRPNVVSLSLQILDELFHCSVCVASFRRA